MKKRLISVALAAGATVLASPGASHAIVADVPEPGFPEFNGVVNTIIHRGNVVYVGGSFKRVIDNGRSYARPGAAAFNRVTGDLLPWKPAVAGTVTDMAWSREGIYLAGTFRKVKRQPRKNVALVTAKGAGKLKPLNVKVVGPVNAIGLDARKVYIGGGITRVAGKPRVRLAAFARKTGKLAAWAPKAQGAQGDAVLDLKVSRAGVYVGGYFKLMNGRPAFQRLALVNRTKGKTVTSFNPATTYPVVTLLASGGVVYAGLGGRAGGGLDAVNSATGVRVWADTPRLDGDVQALALLNGVLYAGGHFDNICAPGSQEPNGDCPDLDRTPRFRGASFDPATGALGSPGWDPRANTQIGITALDAYANGEQLLAGGDFTQVRNQTFRRLAVFAP